MLKYVMKRLILLIPILLGVMFIVFNIMALTPGTPGRMILGTMASQEAVDKIDEELGFNRPFIIRFADYVVNAAQGDFGRSYNTQNPVFSEIFGRFPTTLKLAILSIITSAIIGIPIGILSAVKQYSLVDVLSTSAALFFAAIPGFWLGLMLMLYFALELKILPSGGISTWKHFILPTIALSLPSAAGILRMTRSTMLETIRQDYIRTARAKGAKEGRIIWVHALKNALLPVVTSLGIRFGFMLGGTILVESVFSMPGLGALIVTAIRQKDIPLVMGTVIFLATLFSLVMLLVDIVYAYIDPRVKARYVK